MSQFQDLKILIISTDKTSAAEAVKAFKTLKITQLKAVADLAAAQSLQESFHPDLLFVSVPWKAIADAIDVPIVVHQNKIDPNAVKDLHEAGIKGIIASPISAESMQKALSQSLHALTLAEFSTLKALTSAPQLDELYSKVRIRPFMAGDMLCDPKVHKDTLLILAKGQAEFLMFKDQTQYLNQVVSEGSFLNVGAFFGHGREKDFIVGSQDGVIIELPKAVFDSLSAPLASFFVKKAATQLAEHHKSLCERVCVGETLFKTKKISPKKQEVKPPPPPPPPKKPEEKALEEPVEAPKEGEVSPFSTRTGAADQYHPKVRGAEEYEVLQKKLGMRMEFIAAKLPMELGGMVRNKMYGYWTGGKLSKVNPHKLWSVKSFLEGSTRLVRALHLVVASSKGDKAYKKAFLDLPLSHRVVGLPQIGCSGTFLGSDEAVDRYIAGQNPVRAVEMDFDIPIDRIWKGTEVIEFLTHTAKDVREETLFLIFDDVDGTNTRKFRTAFPEHQMITIVKGFDFKLDEPSTFFTMPEEKLAEAGHMAKNKASYGDSGFYMGQTFFMPDVSVFYEGLDVLKTTGTLFGMIAVFADIGPDYSGIIWGSKGGAEGAVKAARAMFGIKGAQSAGDLSAAVNWADG